VGEVAGEAQGDRRPLLRRQRPDPGPDAGVGVCQLGALVRDLLDRLDRQRPPPIGAMVVDRLAVGDRHQPAAQVVVALEPRVGAQGGEKGLLKAVVGVDPADRPAQDPEHLAGVTVEQDLERGKRAHHRD
jgi:hypothetical protein